ncbi:MAG: hypothetical protein AVDCRST_MAG89-3518, partial [uncultured Gemmatimonadetes bacterium]
EGLFAFCGAARGRRTRGGADGAGQHAAVAGPSAAHRHREQSPVPSRPDRAGDGRSGPAPRAGSLPSHCFAGLRGQRRLQPAVHGPGPVRRDCGARRGAGKQLQPRQPGTRHPLHHPVRRGRAAPRAPGGPGGLPGDGGPHRLGRGACARRGGAALLGSGAYQPGHRPGRGAPQVRARPAGIHPRPAAGRRARAHRRAGCRSDGRRAGAGAGKGARRRAAGAGGPPPVHGRARWAAAGAHRCPGRAVRPRGAGRFGGRGARRVQPPARGAGAGRRAAGRAPPERRENQSLAAPEHGRQPGPQPEQQRLFGIRAAEPAGPGRRGQLRSLVPALHPVPDLLPDPLRPRRARCGPRGFARRAADGGARRARGRGGAAERAYRHRAVRAGAGAQPPPAGAGAAAVPRGRPDADGADRRGGARRPRRARRAARPRRGRGRARHARRARGRPRGAL